MFGAKKILHRSFACLSPVFAAVGAALLDRKSTRLNSSHLGISYAVFCLKKKKKEQNYIHDWVYDPILDFKKQMYIIGRINAYQHEIERIIQSKQSIEEVGVVSMSE